MVILLISSVLCSCNSKGKVLDNTLFTTQGKLPDFISDISDMNIKDVSINSQMGEDKPKAVNVSSKEDIKTILGILKSVKYKELVVEEIPKGWLILIRIERDNGDIVVFTVNSKFISIDSKYYEVNEDVTEQLQQIYKKIRDKLPYCCINKLDYKDIKKVSITSQMEEEKPKSVDINSSSFLSKI